MAPILDVLEELDKGKQLDVDVVGNLCGWNLDTITTVIREIEDQKLGRTPGYPYFYKQQKNADNAVALLRQALGVAVRRG